MTQETKNKIEGIIGVPLEEHSLNALERVFTELASPFNKPLEKALILKDGTETFIIKRSDVCGIEYGKGMPNTMIRLFSGGDHRFPFKQNEAVLENFIQDFKDGY